MIVNTRDVAGHEPSCESMMVEQRFPSSPIVVEQRFSHEHSMVEKGLRHGFMMAEQALPHIWSTIEYGLLPSRVFSNMDEDI